MLPLGLTFVQRRKWALGPATGIKTFFSGRLMPTEVVEVAVDSSTVIAIGDAIYLATDDGRPASLQADGGTLAANQEAFHDAFVGFALEASADGETTPIAVAAAGIMEMDCASSTFEVGDLVGMSENGGGTALLNTTGIAVATANLAVGRVIERRSVANTKVKVAFVSTVILGGPQAMA